MQKFEPDQLVLVRDDDTKVWRLTHYSHKATGKLAYTRASLNAKKCHI